MGYDMSLVKTGDYFRANIWAMGMLRQVMYQAGVDCETVSLRTTQEREDGEQYSAEGTLLTCFGSNDGWLVRPEECREIAEKLRKHNVTEYQEIDFSPGAKPKPGEPFPIRTAQLDDDLKQYIQEFADYCERTAEEGGFYVW